MSKFMDYRSVHDDDELTLLDISDYRTAQVLPNLHPQSDVQQYFKTMGKISDRTNCGSSFRSAMVSSFSTISSDMDEDSGFCGSNLSPPSSKIPRLDNDVLYLKALMRENETQSSFMETCSMQSEDEMVEKLPGTYPAKSRYGNYELRIISQPEEQHRARYLTEGSRGSIKDRTGTGHPVVKLMNYKDGSVKLQCFIGHDKHIGTPHLFYQASKITGKNSTRCSAQKIDGTTVVTLELHPENNMEATIDCIGILKERNVDVEQKIQGLKGKLNPKGEPIALPNKKRSTRCRLIFRCKIPKTNEMLQVVSNPILCTQPLGTPEISKMSISECGLTENKELFLIGKNFLKDTKVVFRREDGRWSKTVDPDKEYLHSSHLVCTVPVYDGPVAADRSNLEVSVSVRSGGKYSETQSFTFLNNPSPNIVPQTNLAEIAPTVTLSHLQPVDQVQHNLVPDSSTFYLCPSMPLSTVSESLPTTVTSEETMNMPVPQNMPKPVTLSTSATGSTPLNFTQGLAGPMSFPLSIPVRGPPPAPATVPVPGLINQGSPIISEVSQMTDNELLRLINPSTFE